MLALLHKILGGSSPQTGYLGSLTIAVDGLQMVQTAMLTEGMPADPLQWLILLLGIGLRLAKDANKSNAIHPATVAQTVKALFIPLLLLVGLTACQTGDGKKFSERMLKIRGDVHKVLIEGCDAMPGVMVATSTVQEFLPANQDISKGIEIGQDLAAKICAKVHAAQ